MVNNTHIAKINEYTFLLLQSFNRLREMGQVSHCNLCLLCDCNMSANFPFFIEPFVNSLSGTQIVFKTN